MAQDIVRIAAVADIHCSRTSQGAFRELFEAVNKSADVLLLGGDLTDYGLPEEADILAQELAHLKVPVLAVLGNHDHESGKQDDVSAILREAGVVMLDGGAYEVCGIGFAGTKGFGGGFGRGMLAPWGEAAVKSFVQEAVNEAQKLESALAGLKTKQKIVLLHYAPVRATVEGEPPEVFAFLGSSRLEEPLARYPVTAVFHGHAHKGTFEGKTGSGIPVYNVAAPVLMQRFPDRPPFFLLELPPGGAAPSYLDTAPAR